MATSVIRQDIPGGTFAAPGRAETRYAPENYDRYKQDMDERTRRAVDKRQKKKKDDRKRKESQGPPSTQSALKVETVEFYPLNNANEHHTERYELVEQTPPTPVIRRGQPFYMAARFIQRSYDPQRDWLKLVFKFGPQPNFAKGTRADIVLGAHTKFSRGQGKWDARIHHNDGKLLTLQVYETAVAGNIPGEMGKCLRNKIEKIEARNPGLMFLRDVNKVLQGESEKQLNAYSVNVPPDCCVGIWKCRIATQLKDKQDAAKEGRRKFDCTEDIYILFNPWCKDDQVFIENEAWRREYVLNDIGKLYVGSYHNPIGRRWVFGQYDDIILPACMLLLEKTKLDYPARGNPVKVVRAISAIINSRDDNGLVVDNWSSDYRGGTCPTDWTGSVKIIEEFMKSGGKPVKYGQCWVFSGCTTTICRALGIPCRSVTNFVSAHDTDESLSIDRWHDKNGDLLASSYNNETVWNFHVWNDVWMSRPDLPTGYGGWQAIDGTPQEMSEDVYQVGPASLEAIRRGEVGLNYDTIFLISEVNADIIHWQMDDLAEVNFRKLRTVNYHVGRKVVTKRPDRDDDNGNTDLEDITQQYKNKEGTQAERLQMLNAARTAGLRHLYDLPSNEKEDVFFDLIEIDKIMIGQPFNVTVKMQNKSTEKRTIFCMLSANTVYYTGVHAYRIKKQDGTYSLQPNHSETLSLRVNPVEYLDKLVDYSMIKIFAMASVKETKQVWAEEDDFACDKPNINLEVRGTPQLNREFTLVCSFTNPLSCQLHECHFSFEGPGVTKPTTVPFRDIQPGETITHLERFLPQKAGERKIVATFNSNRLTELFGSITINVRE